VVVVALATIPEGVSAGQVGDVPVVIVRQVAEVTVFVNGVRNQDTLSWCRGDRTEGYITSVLYGSQFGLDGDWWGGPAGHDLNRLWTTTEGDRLRIDSRRILEGEGPAAGDPFVPTLPAGRMDTVTDPPPGTYCPTAAQVDAIVARRPVRA
jgi:hypothetical protein